MTIHNLYLDVETLPTDDEAVKRFILESIEAPSNYKDPQKISDYKAEKASEAVAKTGLDAAFGRLAIIGFAIGDDPVTTWTATDGEVEKDGERFTKPGLSPFDEKALLQSFFELFDGNAIVRVIGHNVVNFDIRFIVQRAVILGLKIPRWFPIAPRAWDDNVFDTMIAWAGTHDRVSLDKLSRALGIGGKYEGLDGSKFAGLWATDPVRAALYCADDVEKARLIHRRMSASLYTAA
ncbi:3'-5' exonuclease [Methylosinus sp. PW1]|uniref:3'-5' exonuclease n=1 Tax=Methylosinus sp. PW1 TaxID=107636 RepID=UPI00055C66F1|nr:3'-5' exonuclease [Methylosinus sp. PW1]